MRVLARYKKLFAAFFLALFTTQLLTPAVSYALTSGPSQPEMQGFQPIGSSDMVDLSSGDFSYNIPLMDAGGYPVNIAYHSGDNMDDESSWVGYGWSLNVGNINRQLRGVPDDFNGTDLQTRQMNIKEHITKGGKFSATLDLLGIPLEKIKVKVGKKKKKLNLKLTLSVGITSDNYRGIGMDLGANSGLSLSEYSATQKTVNDPVDITNTGNSRLSGDLGLTLSSTNGASFNIGANMQIIKPDLDDKKNYSASLGFGYNSRAGLSGMTLGTSFSMREKLKKGGVEKFFTTYESGRSSFMSFNEESFTPTIEHPMKSNSFTFSMHYGPEVYVVFAGFGVSGFYSKQKLAQNILKKPAYGFMFSQKGKNDLNAILDINREKDIPYHSQIKYMPIPIPTYDLFSGGSQDGGGQYRLYGGSSGVFFDGKKETVGNDYSVGIEAGGGTYFDVGTDLYFQDIRTKTHKWINRNNFLAKGDFQTPSSTDITYEKAYFKRVGEPVPADMEYYSTIKKSEPASVFLTKNVLNGVLGAEATNMLRTNSAKDGEATNILKKTKRDVRNTNFSYLSANEAANHALEKQILDYKPDSLAQNNCNPASIKSIIQRNTGYRKGHHLSEITVTGDDGKRNIYGLPVYNTYQEEVSFSVGANLGARNRGLTNYNTTDASLQNKKGRDNYYSKEITPPYATSYLLTSVLSPDYVDLTRNGISDDDLGTAVKFNYTKLDQLYKWRTPYAKGVDTANYNEGILNDDQDDKANYVYGEKEVWYLHSIESKTMVVSL